jgi:hypothetical protein
LMFGGNILGTGEGILILTPPARKFIFDVVVVVVVVVRPALF